MDLNNPATWTCTDAQWAAWQAAEALRDGRYELGYQFARLARDAFRTEQLRALHEPAAPVDEPRGQLYDEHARPIDLNAYRQTQRPDLYEHLVESQNGTVPATVPAEALQPDRPDLGATITEHARAAAAQLLNNTQVMPAVPPEPGQVTRSARCRAMVITSRTADGATTAGECHGVLAWAEHPTDPSATGWMHMDHTLDDHAPQV